MPPSQYERGRRIEYRAVEELEKRGYLAQRAASSKGNWDVWGVNATGIILVSCKRTASEKTARAVYNAEKKKLLGLLDALPKEGVQQAMFIWADALPDKPRGGWFVQEVITP